MIKTNEQGTWIPTDLTPSLVVGSPIHIIDCCAYRLLSVLPETLCRTTRSLDLFQNLIPQRGHRTGTWRRVSHISVDGGNATAGRVGCPSPSPTSLCHVLLADDWVSKEYSCFCPLYDTPSRLLQDVVSGRTTQSERRSRQPVPLALLRGSAEPLFKCFW
jgi:hypothetical protein